FDGLQPVDVARHRHRQNPIDDHAASTIRNGC
ncbi:MAG: hypothetical protein ACI9UU_003621, partial [Candidatus Azotimanducaceae bacterium]